MHNDACLLCCYSRQSEPACHMHCTSRHAVCRACHEQYVQRHPPQLTAGCLCCAGHAGPQLHDALAAPSPPASAVHDAVLTATPGLIIMHLISLHPPDASRCKDLLYCITG